MLVCHKRKNLDYNLNWQAPKEEGKKKKKGGGKTVSSVYLVSLMELMAQVSEGGSCLGMLPLFQLHNCEPHFVRCLVPNTHKKPGEVEPHLIVSPPWKWFLSHDGNFRCTS